MAPNYDPFNGSSSFKTPSEKRYWISDQKATPPPYGPGVPGPPNASGPQPPQPHIAYQGFPPQHYWKMPQIESSVRKAIDPNNPLAVGAHDVDMSNFKLSYDLNNSPLLPGMVRLTNGQTFNHAGLAPCVHPSSFSANPNVRFHQPFQYQPVRFMGDINVPSGPPAPDSRLQPGVIDLWSLHKDTYKPKLCPKTGRQLPDDPGVWDHLKRR